MSQPLWLAKFQTCSIEISSEAKVKSWRNTKTKTDAKNCILRPQCGRQKGLISRWACSLFLLLAELKIWVTGSFPFLKYFCPSQNMSCFDFSFKWYLERRKWLLEFSVCCVPVNQGFTYRKPCTELQLSRGTQKATHKTEEEVMLGKTHADNI